jgi:hypothetical protein
LEKSAEKIVKEPKFDGKSDLDIMKEVIVAKFPGTNLDGKSEAYVQARYDMAIESGTQDAAELEKLRKTHVHRDGDIPSLEDARKKMIADSKDAWKTPSELGKK